MRKLSGFTLVEMLIVIAIIGILSSALIPRMSSSKNKAINVATEKSIRDVTNALFLYYSDKGSYPIATTCNGTDFSNCSLASVQSQLAQYLSSIPTPSYTQPTWSFGSGNNVPANQFGYAGLGSRYILSYHMVDTRDGQKYKVVNMPDGQRWMAENLNYKISNSMCFGNNDANCDNGYGRFYTRTDAQPICPLGWHLPSGDEWANMLNKVESLYNGSQDHPRQLINNGFISYGLSAGTQLKTSSAGGVDSFGFSALRPGERNGSAWADAGADGPHRSTEKSGALNVGVGRVFLGAGKVVVYGYPSVAKIPVRCVKD